VHLLRKENRELADFFDVSRGSHSRESERRKEDLSERLTRLALKTLEGGLTLLQIVPQNANNQRVHSFLIFKGDNL
jgi:hypothetical protein